MKSDEVQEKWNELIDITMEAAIKKHGVFFKVRTVENTGINKNIIGRFFRKREMSRFETVIKILDSLDLELIIKKKKKLKKIKA